VLELDQLRVPALLNEPRVTYRVPTERDVVEKVAEFRVAYQVELLGAVRTPKLEEWTREEMHRQRLAENCWILVLDDEPVAFTAFTAKTRGIAQVGGVYTPPWLRNRGYGRAVVAASLLVARARGMTRSTLFTGIDNHAAMRAYGALGYERRGDYAIVLFR
jgi:predicted GNAT family acetyltransferase